MHEIEIQPAAAPPRKRSRWRKRAAIGALIVLLLAAGYVFLFVSWADRDLREALAEADRLDPGWRWNELEAKRSVLADDENSATCVLRADSLLANIFWRNWAANPETANQDPDKALRELPPNAPLTRLQVTALTGALAKTHAALVEARKLKDLPSGRYPPVLDHFGLRFSVAHIRAAEAVALLLGYDEVLREFAGESDAALDSCRAAFNVARSFGEESDTRAQRTRLEIRLAACRNLERTLAQCQPSEVSLTALQRLLEEEETQPLFLFGARGLRCELDGLLVPPRPDTANQNRLVRLGAAYGRPSALRMTTRLVEIAKLPVEEQAYELNERGLPSAKMLPVLGPAFSARVQAVAKLLSELQIRSQAQLRCAVAALAAERYRRAHGGWPASLDALVPAYLHSVPIDPFSKNPLRYVRVPDGVVIYCVQPGGQDKGGKHDRQRGDIGMQLWDLDRRPLHGPAG